MHRWILIVYAESKRCPNTCSFQNIFEDLAIYYYCAWQNQVRRSMPTQARLIVLSAIIYYNNISLMCLYNAACAMTTDLVIKTDGHCLVPQHSDSSPHASTRVMWWNSIWSRSHLFHCYNIPTCVTCSRPGFRSRSGPGVVAGFLQNASTSTGCDSNVHVYGTNVNMV